MERSNTRASPGVGQLHLMMRISIVGILIGRDELESFVTELAELVGEFSTFVEGFAELSAESAEEVVIDFHAPFQDIKCPTGSISQTGVFVKHKVQGPE